MGKITEPILWDENWESAVEKAIEKLKEICPSYTQTMPSDPGIAILEAAVYILDLLGIALNRLPYASLVSWVNYLGIEKKGAQPAVANLKLVFSTPLPEALLIPKGELFSTDDGLLFETKEEVTVPEGATEYEIEVVCTEAGTIGNVEANKIVYPVRPIPHLAEVLQPQPATGGFDSELDDEALERGRKIIRHLWRAVHADDFEQIALSVPGVAKAKTIEVPGKVEVYVLPSDRQPLEGELRQKVWEAIESVRIRAIPWDLKQAVLKKIDILARVRLLPGYSLESVRRLAEEALQKYLDPYAWIWGRRVPLGELMQVLEGVQGIDYVDELLLPTESVKLEEYELADLGEVNLESV